MKPRIICFLVVACLISFASSAEEETNIFAVTPENCGEMPLTECTEFMEWAKKDMASVQKSIDEDRAAINRMHDDALELLNKDNEGIP